MIREVIVEKIVSTPSKNVDVADGASQTGDTEHVQAAVVDEILNKGNLPSTRLDISLLDTVF